jgi:hypothetical protein
MGDGVDSDTELASTVDCLVSVSAAVIVAPMASAIESANDVVVEEAVMLPPVDFDTDGERRDVSAVLGNNAPPVVSLSAPLVKRLRATVVVPPTAKAVRPKLSEPSVSDPRTPITEYYDG